MRIAVNTRLLLKNRLEGIGWFAVENLSRITLQHPEHEFIFIFDRPFDDSFIFAENVEGLVAFPPARHPLLFYWWFEHTLPKVLRKCNADVFVSPDGYLSLNTPLPSLSVMHDLNFEHYPEDIPWSARKHYRYYFPRYAQKARRIATVSEFSKQDIVNQYHINPDKVDVVYNGANEAFVPLLNEEKTEQWRKFTRGHPYFVFVGALHPRKNLVNLFKAFDQFKASDDEGIKLLIVGEKMYWTEAIKNAYDGLQYKEDVIFSGRLELTELTKAVGAARALLYVSYFEGFGIPIVEAFNAEVPVITSQVTSMPEVAGDAALMVDPFSVDSIAEALKQIAVDDQLCEALIEKGKIRKNKFTWQKSSERLWDSIEKIL